MTKNLFVSSFATACQVVVMKGRQKATNHSKGCRSFWIDFLPWKSKIISHPLMAHKKITFHPNNFKIKLTTVKLKYVLYLWNVIPWQYFSEFHPLLSEKCRYFFGLTLSDYLECWWRNWGQFLKEINILQSPVECNKHLLDKRLIALGWPNLSWDLRTNIPTVHTTFLLIYTS